MVQVPAAVCTYVCVCLPTNEIQLVRVLVVVLKGVQRQETVSLTALPHCHTFPVLPEQTENTRVCLPGWVPLASHSRILPAVKRRSHTTAIQSSYCVDKSFRTGKKRKKTLSVIKLNWCRQLWDQPIKEYFTSPNFVNIKMCSEAVAWICMHSRIWGYNIFTVL